MHDCLQGSSSSARRSDCRSEGRQCAGRCAGSGSPDPEGVQSLASPSCGWSLLPLQAVSMHHCHPYPLQDKGQEHLVDKLTKNVGFGMGLEFRESANVLSADSQVPVRTGMVFNVSIGKYIVSATHDDDRS